MTAPQFEQNRALPGSPVPHWVQYTGMANPPQENLTDVSIRRQPPFSSIFPASIARIGVAQMLSCGVGAGCFRSARDGSLVVLDGQLTLTVQVVAFPRTEKRADI